MALDDRSESRLEEPARAPAQRAPRRGTEHDPERDSERDDAKDDSPEQSAHRSRVSRRSLVIGGVALLLVLALGALLYWLHARHFEDTDDAFIDTHMIHVSPQIAGQVLRVYVNDNQRVRAGEPLVDLDPSDEQARLQEALANQAQAETQLQQAQAQQTAAQAAHEQAMANAAAAAAQAVNAARDYERYSKLKITNPRAVAQIQLDQSEAAQRSTSAQLVAARQQVRSAAVQIDVARTQVAGAQARIKAAAASVAESRIALGYTRIVAPVDGHVAQLTVAIGNYITPGGQMMSIVPTLVWVTANFKETDLDLIRPGQPVSVHVDACPGADLAGHVDSVERGAGQAFALLPPENATGNYVKVVQRVPVKIVLEQYPRDCPIGPGMSVEPKVRVR
ncbi:MAG TPA: HlyD family secretion protein [Steroidobacteraceae bacterium]|nr:HlyD family secretion protein [Steroidobacteraceae bacterium]